jgi:hypothetical protein
LITAETGQRKPRLLIVTRNSGFAKALRAIIAQDRAECPLRAGKNFLSIAYQQLARFTVEIEIDTATGFSNLLTWAQRYQFSPKLVGGIQASLLSQTT